MCIHTHTYTLGNADINMDEHHKHYINEKLKGTLFYLDEVQNIAKPKINCIGIHTYKINL